MKRFCAYSLLLAVLSAFALVPPALGAGAQTRFETPGFRGLHWQPPSNRRGLSDSPDWIFGSRRHEVNLTDEEEILQHLDLVIRARSDQPLPSFVPVVVIDEAAGDLCEWDLDRAEVAAEVGRKAESDALIPSTAEVEIEVRPAPAGFQHLGRPALCGFLLGKERTQTGESLRLFVSVRRPRPARMEERFALFVAAQGLGAPTELLELAVLGYGPEGVAIDPVLWRPELRQRALRAGRLEHSVRAEAISALPLVQGSLSVAGRVPGFWLHSGASWDAVALEHRAWYEAATVLDDSLIPLAGRVLGSSSLLASVQEAARLALDEVRWDPTEGGGGTWLLPRRASSVARDAEGTTADRAALLLALLRGAGIRAEVVFSSTSPLDISPAGSPRPLNRVLVLVPELQRPDGNGPLFIDPSFGSERLFARDPALLGRPALLLGPNGARWLRLNEDPDRSRWTLNVRETQPDTFVLRLEGVLAGEPAARVLEWTEAGAVTSDAPWSILSWFASWGDELRWQVEATPEGARVLAEGELGREQLAPGGLLAAPSLPSPAPAESEISVWPYARDTQPLDVELLESWSFRAAGPGGGAPPHERSTPFWEISSLGRWTGPVFNRRSRIRWTARSVSAHAAVEVERFSEAVKRVFGGIRAPL